MELTQMQKEQTLLAYITLMVEGCDDEAQLRYLTKEQCINVMLKARTTNEQTTEDERAASIQSLLTNLYNDVMGDS